MAFLIVVVCCILGLAVGGIVGNDSTAGFGFFAGIAFGIVFARLRTLSARIESLKREVTGTTAAPASTAAWNCAIVAPCARKRSLRCTIVTLAARSRSCVPQSNAESPPPMITTRRPRNTSGSVTTSWMPRPYHGSAHACGSRRGENAPMPAATTIDRVGKRSLSVTSTK